MQGNNFYFNIQLTKIILIKLNSRTSNFSVFSEYHKLNSLTYIVASAARHANYLQGACSKLWQITQSGQSWFLFWLAAGRTGWADAVMIPSEMSTIVVSYTPQCGPSVTRRVGTPARCRPPLYLAWGGLTMI